MEARAWIGLSGYSYKPWQGEDRFYPTGLKQTEFLGYYAGRYDAVEMDGTWYQMPAEKSVADWGSKTPDEFRFSFKLHRKITHVARLKLEALDSLRFMLKRLGPLASSDKLGPLLIQLPPNLKRNDDRLGQFLENLPTEIEGVQTLRRPLEWAVEFRNDSWHSPAVEEIMRRHAVAWVAAETDEAAAERRDTGPSHYVRLRKSEYSEAELAGWASYFRSTGKPCYVYCKHEDEGSPWIVADDLLKRLRSGL